MRINRFVPVTLLVLSAITPQYSTVFAQGTAFTYQGQLTEGSKPATGLYDFEFALWPASTGGSRVAGPVGFPSVAVSGGVFTVTIDFAGSVFDGSPRWLEILVRTNNGGAFAALSPRQQVTTAPYAMTAAKVTGQVTAGQLSGNLEPATLPSGGNWPLTSPLSIDSGTLSIDPGADWVGIGTTTPTAPLTVHSTNSFYGMEHTDGTRRLSTYLDENGGWFGSVSAHKLFFYVNNGAPSMTIDLDGQVGIGTMSPVDSLHVVQGLASVRLDSVSNPNGSVLELRNTMVSPNYLGAINFNNASGTYPGQIGYLPNHDMIFRTANAERMRLDSSGGLRVQGSIRLDAADAPMIVRQWDVFTSGSKTGSGRWGLFMEPNTLFLGIPGADYGPISSIGFGGWLANGTRQNWMTISKGGNVGVGTTTPADKLHVAGDLRVDGQIKLSPTQRWISLAASRFVPWCQDSWYGVSYLEPGFVWAVYGNINGSFPVELPDGAKWIQVVIACEDSTSLADIKYTLQAVNATSGATIDLATAQTSGVGALQSLTMNSFTLPYVNNSQMCYALKVEKLPPGRLDNNDTFQQLKVMPVRIRYELNSLP